MLSNALFAEVGGFPKINLVDSAWMTEHVPPNVPFFSESKFSEDHKRSDEYIMNRMIS